MPHPASLYQVSPSSGVPIYRQLVEQVERLVLSGQLREGDLLPSVRETAQALEINPMTVSRAYSLLESEGWLARARGKGMRVAADRRLPQRPGSAATALAPTIRQLLAEAAQIGIDPPALIAIMREVAGIQGHEP